MKLKTGVEIKLNKKGVIKELTSPHDDNDTINNPIHSQNYVDISKAILFHNFNPFSELCNEF